MGVGVGVGVPAGDGSRPQHSAASFAENAQVCSGPPIKPTEGDRGVTGVGGFGVSSIEPSPSSPPALLPQQRTSPRALRKHVLIAPQAKLERRAFNGKAPASASLMASVSGPASAPGDVLARPPQAAHSALAASPASVRASAPVSILETMTARPSARNFLCRAQRFRLCADVLRVESAVPGFCFLCVSLSIWAQKLGFSLPAIEHIPIDW